MAAAAGAAHERGIVHRDLKPENIFLTGAGEVSATTRVKVLDFGIARALHRDGAERITREGEILGSPMYMSPEQVFGEETLDHRTDLWSLGIVLYECLVGAPPTRARNTGQVFKIITRQGAPPIGLVAPDTPPELAHLLADLYSNRTPAAALEAPGRSSTC